MFLIDGVLQVGLEAVFCGTALGRTSEQSGAYSAHSGNSFWKTIYRTGLTDRPLRPPKYRGLLESGIGLTDLCSIRER
jgi:TDG/mug DNA glycosylase family protein